MLKIETARTFLRTFETRDLDSLAKLMSNINVMMHTGFKTTRSKSEVKDLLAKWMLDQDVWAAVCKETEELLGWFMLKKTIGDDPEIGFMIVEDKWGQGFATEIASGLISDARENKGVKKVVASVHENNIASIRVLTKMGMVASSAYPQKDHIIYYEC